MCACCDSENKQAELNTAEYRVSWGAEVLLWGQPWRREEMISMAFTFSTHVPPSSSFSPDHTLSFLHLYWSRTPPPPLTQWRANRNGEHVASRRQRASGNSLGGPLDVSSTCQKVEKGKFDWRAPRVVHHSEKLCVQMAGCDNVILQEAASHATNHISEEKLQNA